MERDWIRTTLSSIGASKRSLFGKTLETHNFRFFMANRKPQNVTWPRSCGRVCSLQFAVHVWTAGRASSIKWLLARFFATKNCTASRLKAQNSFFASVCDVFVGFLNSNQFIIPVFWAIKVMHFDLMKNNMAALNNDRVVKNRFYIPFCHTNIGKFYVPIKSFSILLLNS